MSKINKKRRKLIERIEILQDELINSLTKKDSNTVEINVATKQRKIQALKKELKEL
jgi:hypothetical protein